MAGQFVHLHLHTDYSLLDGACHISWSKIKDKEERRMKGDLVTLALENNSPAVAMTDHGVMGGAVEFFEEMEAIHVKPIVGCEVYVAPNSRLEKDPHVPHYRGYHLILLAMNAEGYLNLCKIVSESHLHGYYYKPRTDKEFLAQHSKGLIAMNACLQGELAVSILTKGHDAAVRTLMEYRDIFGKENFFLEVMYHGIEEQKTVNREVMVLSKEFGIPMVATNDVHYPRKPHARSQDILLCVQTRTTLDDPNRMKMSHDEFYYKSYDEMMAVFGTEIPEAVPNTLMVAERCNFKFDFKQNHYPVYQVPETTTQADVLREICVKNVSRCFGFDLEHHAPEFDEKAKEIRERMDYELDVIIRTKYPSYFLVVWDFINAAKKKGIPVGLGRGSGAGSLVAYLAGITNIDPLQYKLFFERFLNPERVSPPDFDIDFCERRRGEVIDYVINKYGAESVAQIATYGALKAKNAIKDVARVLGNTPSEGDRITKLIPNDPKMTLTIAYKEIPEFKDFINSNDWAKKIYTEALPVEGLNRTTGIHACGVIIGDQRLDNIVPLIRGAHDESVVQYIAHPCEQLGLLKMDFLGLRTLTVIQDALDNIRKNRKIDIDIDRIPLNDQPTFDLLNRGDTVAVFQLESGGMQALCRQFVVESVENIIALLAIYRPGPMEFIPTFVARKKGEEKIEYDHPKMEPILKETYGIMLYQEQIMEVVKSLAGFTLGHADIVRRAIGKKKEDVMAKQRLEFIDGCKEANNIAPELADQIWEKIKKFAGYGFNKSHSAAYGVLSYRTAYLKANYPQEFLASVLTSELDNSEKVSFLINECREQGIPILPPDINKSDINFTVDGKAIRFGLGAIRGLGQVASAAIIESRDKDGPYKDMVNLLERAGANINSKAIESLVRAGAFDSMGVKRSQLLATIEESVQCATSRRKDKESGQGSLFDMLGGDSNDFDTVQLPDIPEIDEIELLQNEKQLLGFYISGHPAGKYSVLIDSFSTVNTLKMQELDGDTGVKIGGIIISSVKKISKKNGKAFLIAQMEDTHGSVEVAIYEKALETCKDFIFENDAPVFIRGITRKFDENSPVTLTANEIVPLTSILDKETQAIHVHLFEVECKPDTIANLRGVLKKHAGTIPVVICVSTSKGPVAFIEIAREFYVTPSDELLHDLDDLLGARRYKIKNDPTVPVARPRYSAPQPSETGAGG